jgi:hypothetical protein
VTGFGTVEGFEQCLRISGGKFLDRIIFGIEDQSGQFWADPLDAGDINQPSEPENLGGREPGLLRKFPARGSGADPWKQRFGILSSSVS